MYSTRTYNSECLNGEGLKDLHLSDGVLNIYQSGTFNANFNSSPKLICFFLGNEFEYIFPTWNWEKIPGITCALGEVPIECNTVCAHLFSIEPFLFSFSNIISQLKVLGKTNFVGGVSDGTYGATAFDFHAALNGKLTARYAEGNFFIIIAVLYIIINNLFNIKFNFLVCTNII